MRGKCVGCDPGVLDCVTQCLQLLETSQEDSIKRFLCRIDPEKQRSEVSLQD